MGPPTYRGVPAAPGRAVNGHADEKPILGMAGARRGSVGMNGAINRNETLGLTGAGTIGSHAQFRNGDSAGRDGARCPVKGFLQDWARL